MRFKLVSKCGCDVGCPKYDGLDVSPGTGLVLLLGHWEARSYASQVAFPDVYVYVKEDIGLRGIYVSVSSPKCLDRPVATNGTGVRPVSVE